jgi:hypothetical protein
MVHGNMVMNHMVVNISVKLKINVLFPLHTLMS